MRVLIDLNHSSLKPSKALAPLIQSLCTSLAIANRIILKNASIPLIYDSGVRYRPEPVQWPFERFDNAATCFARGWGDCDDLASWRCAELLNQGEKANIIVSWKPAEGGRLYHITVRRANGAKEDPSARLGMKPAHVR